jgi:hypothetical protein
MIIEIRNSHPWLDRRIELLRDRSERSHQYGRGCTRETNPHSTLVVTSDYVAQAWFVHSLVHSR